MSFEDREYYDELLAKLGDFDLNILADPKVLCNEMNAVTFIERENQAN